MGVFKFFFLLGVDLCTIDSILPAGALVLVVWWGGGLFVRVLEVLQFRFSCCFCFFGLLVLFVFVFFVVFFSTINQVVAGEKL